MPRCISLVLYPQWHVPGENTPVSARGDRLCFEMPNEPGQRSLAGFSVTD